MCKLTFSKIAYVSKEPLLLSLLWKITRSSTSKMYKMHRNEKEDQSKKYTKFNVRKVVFITSRTDSTTNNTLEKRVISLRKEFWNTGGKAIIILSMHVQSLYYNILS